MPRVVRTSRTPGRRVAGLRSEDVAELLGVSDAWYSRFECGRVRLSTAALARLAVILRHSADERAKLFALARPEIGSNLGGLLVAETTGVHEVSIVQRLLRELRHASDLGDIVVNTVRAVNDAMKPTNVAFWVRQSDDAGNAVFDYVEGPAADGYIGLAQSAEAAAHERDAVLANDRIWSESIAESPSEEYRQRVGRFGARSYTGIGIGPAAGPWVAIGFANATPGAFAPISIATLNTIGEVARSALFRLSAQA